MHATAVAFRRVAFGNSWKSPGFDVPFFTLLLHGFARRAELQSWQNLLVAPNTKLL
jgi:hypothetical protein